MGSPAIDIKDYLLDQFSWISFGDDLFVGVLPDQGDQIVSVVLDSFGGPPEPNDIENPTVQLMTRGTRGGYPAAWSRMEELCNVLHGLANTTLNGTWYIQVWKLGNIVSVGNDEKGRPVLSCTFRIQRSVIDIPENDSFPYTLPFEVA